MKISTFYGGIHPPEYKELTAGLRTESAPLPDEVILPLKQHTGAPAKPVVSPGDEVKTGQVIAEADGLISAPVHSTITGRVLEITTRPHPTDEKGLSVCIRRSMEESECFKKYPGYQDMEPSGVRQIIREGGIVGLGGAAFPTAVKLSPPAQSPIDSFILNGAECEPYITADYRIMCERAEEIILGVKIIMYALGVRRALVGIEANKPQAIKAMRESCPENIEVVELRTKYPQGAEKQLIKAVLNREVPSGSLPMEVGVVVNNVGTALAIAELFVYGKPLIERAVTVTGRGINRPKNLTVRIGTPFSKLIEWCGGLAEDAGKVIMGGPLMGISQVSVDVPVIKGTGAILVMLTEEVDRFTIQNCIRCGSCVDACPMGLLPCELAASVEKKDFSRAESLGAVDCIECGACAYICPSHRDLVYFIRKAKVRILKKAKKKK